MQNEYLSQSIDGITSIDIPNLNLGETQDNYKLRISSILSGINNINFKELIYLINNLYNKIIFENDLIKKKALIEEWLENYKNIISYLKNIIKLIESLNEPDGIKKLQISGIQNKIKELSNQWTEINKKEQKGTIALQDKVNKNHTFLNKLELVGNNVSELLTFSNNFYKQMFGSTDLDIYTQLHIEKVFTEKINKLFGTQDEFIKYILNNNSIGDYNKICVISLYNLNNNTLSSIDKQKIFDITKNLGLSKDYGSNDYGKNNGINILRNINLNIDRPNTNFNEELILKYVNYSILEPHNSLSNELKKQIYDGYNYISNYSGGPLKDLRFNFLYTKENFKIFREIILEAYKDGIPILFKKTTNDSNYGIGELNGNRLLIYCDSKSANYLINKIYDKTNFQKKGSLITKNSKNNYQLEDTFYFPFGEDKGIYIRGSHETDKNYNNNKNLQWLKEQN